MPLVEKVARTLTDPNAAKRKAPADARLSHGRLRTSCHGVTIADGDSPGSTYVVARLPSNAIVKKASTIRSSGISGLDDCDLGVINDSDCLVDGVSLTSTAERDAASAVPLDHYDQPLWQIAGHDHDPTETLSVLLTINSAATATGTILVDLVYVTD